MRALELAADFLENAAFQLRARGDVATRLSYLLGYYSLLGLNELRGLSLAAGRLEALERLARCGLFKGNVRFRYRGADMELDPFSACSMLRDFEVGRQYSHLPSFIPRPGWTVVDVGAHQGLYTLLAASLVGARGSVVAIEPHPGNRSILERNVSRNRLAQVTVCGKAAADFVGAGELCVHRTASMLHSLVFRYANAETIQVRVDTLDHLLEGLGTTRVDLVKIDVEGAYLEVLRGAAKTLSSSRPRVVLEVERRFRFGGCDEVIATLQGMGYRVTEVPPLLYAEPASTIGGLADRGAGEAGFPG